MSDAHHDPHIHRLLLEAVPVPDPGPYQNWGEVSRRAGLAPLVELEEPGSDDFMIRAARLDNGPVPLPGVSRRARGPLGRRRIVASAPAPGLSSPRTPRRKHLAVPILIGACALLGLPAYAVVDRIIAAVTGTAPAPLPLGGVQDLPVAQIPAIGATECTGDVRIAFTKWIATPAQLEALKRRLHGDAAVKSARVISPAQSFALLKKKYPDGVQGLRSNPFSYIVDVWLEQPAHARHFVNRYRATNIPGVQARSITIRRDDDASC
jgi:hypothetical protein